jgi:hypothetical protein
VVEGIRDRHGRRLRRDPAERDLPGHGRHHHRYADTEPDRHPDSVAKRRAIRVGLGCAVRLGVGFSVGIRVGRALRLGVRGTLRVALRGAVGFAVRGAVAVRFTVGVARALIPRPVDPVRAERAGVSCSP